MKLALLVIALGATSARGEPRDAIATFGRELDALFSRDGLTADSAARRAVRSAPATRRKRATVAAASADLAHARLARIPVLAGGAHYAQLSPVDASPMFPTVERSYGLDARIAVPLSDYLARIPALIAGAEVGVEVARTDEQLTTRAIDLQAREAFYEWARAQLQVVVARRQLVQVRSTLEQTRSLAAVERASKADVLRVESARAQTQQLVDRLAVAVAVREEALRLLIDAAGDERLAIGEDLRASADVPELPELEVTLGRGRTKRGELELVASGIRARQALHRAEGAAMAPRLSAFAQIEYATPTTRAFPPSGELALAWSAGVQLTWVFNETLGASATRERITAELGELRAERTGVRQRIQLEVVTAYRTVELALRAIASSSTGVVAAEEGYRVRKDLFAAGRASVVEMVDAETELSRARIAALDARIDLQIAQARLTFATGGAP
jgi:outer membrane protein